VKGASKEAVNITTRAVGGAVADIAIESIKEEIEKSGVKNMVKVQIHKTTMKLTEK